MVIRSGHTEEKQSCLDADREENIPRFCGDVSRRETRQRESCVLKVALYILDNAAPLERLWLSVM